VRVETRPLIADVPERLQDQRQLAVENPDNPLLQVRGNAGTHDIELGRATLEALTSATASDSQVLVCLLYVCHCHA
jgi:pantothenate kinase-related protein Tda10